MSFLGGGWVYALPLGPCVTTYHVLGYMFCHVDMGLRVQLFGRGLRSHDARNNTIMGANTTTAVLKVPHHGAKKKITGRSPVVDGRASPPAAGSPGTAHTPARSTACRGHRRAGGGAVRPPLDEEHAEHHGRDTSLEGQEVTLRGLGGPRTVLGPQQEDEGTVGAQRAGQEPQGVELWARGGPPAVDGGPGRRSSPTDWPPGTTTPADSPPATTGRGRWATG